MCYGSESYDVDERSRDDCVKESERLVAARSSVQSLMSLVGHTEWKDVRQQGHGQKLTTHCA